MNDSVTVREPVSPAMADITLESLNRAIETESLLRSALLGYYRDKMREGYHYYRQTYGKQPDPNIKPSLKKEGALNLCDLFKVKPMPAEPPIKTWDGDHLMVEFNLWLINTNGDIVRQAWGLCSTKESKYRNRPTDYYNTVEQMAMKRALVSATTLLPLVSEIFNQGEDDAAVEHVRANARLQPDATSATPATETADTGGHSSNDSQRRISQTEEGIIAEAFGHLITAKIFSDKKQAWNWFKGEFKLTGFADVTMGRYEQIIARLREMYSNRPASQEEIKTLYALIDECVKLGVYSHAVKAIDDLTKDAEKAVDQLTHPEIQLYLKLHTAQRDGARLKAARKDDEVF